MGLPSLLLYYRGLFSSYQVYVIWDQNDLITLKSMDFIIT